MGELIFVDFLLKIVIMLSLGSVPLSDNERLTADVGNNKINKSHQFFTAKKVEKSLPTFETLKTFPCNIIVTSETGRVIPRLQKTEAELYYLYNSASIENTFNAKVTGLVRPVSFSEVEILEINDRNIENGSISLKLRNSQYLSITLGISEDLKTFISYVKQAQLESQTLEKTCD